MDLAAAFDPGRPLLLMGAGKMGGALLAGWLASGLPPDAVRVVDPAPPPDSAALLAGAGIAATAEPPAAPVAGGVVVAVKPQTLPEALPSIRHLVDSRTLVLSIAAGIPLAKLRDGIGGGRIVRAMPNTPAQIGRGMSVATAGPDLDAAVRELATTLLGAAGAVEWLEDETLIDAATAVSGSGPAYVFLLAEYLAAAGVAEGLPEVLAQRLADTTVAGAGALMAATGETPETLRRNVTSPGGTTAAALAVLMAEDGLAPLMLRAVAAGRRRAEELAG